MAKEAAVKKPAKGPSFSKEDFEGANKKQLRAWCDEYGIPWSKTEDDEAALRKKLQKFVAKLAAAEAEADEPEEETSDSLPFNGKRAPVSKDGKKVDCFGWFYDEESTLCTKKCPHREACKPLTAKAAEVVEEAEEEVEAEEEAASVTEDDAEEVRKAHVKGGKKIKRPEPEEEEEAEEEEETAEEEDKPAKKKAKKEEPEEEAEEEEEAPSITKRRGMITEDSIVKVNFDLDTLAETDFTDNKGLESFYKRVLKASEKSPKKLIKGSLIKKIAADALGLEDEKDVKEVFKDLVRAMTEAKEIEFYK